MTYPFGETVTLRTRSVVGQDGDGNDIPGYVTTTLENIPVWPRNTSELVQGQDTLITGIAALLPAGTSVRGIDKVTVYGDSYEVDGEPGRFHNPFTGTNPGVLVNLTRITG